MGTVCTTCTLDISYLVLYSFVICISQIKKKLFLQKFNLRLGVSITFQQKHELMWEMSIEWELSMYHSEACCILQVYQENK